LEEAEMTNVVHLPVLRSTRPVEGAARADRGDRAPCIVVPLVTVRIERPPLTVVSVRARRPVKGPIDHFRTKRRKRRSGPAADRDEFGEVSIDLEYHRVPPRRVPAFGGTPPVFDLKGFRAFTIGLDLRYFTAEDLLCLGADDLEARAAAGRLPPEHLWPNIADAARMLDEISHRMAARCTILSTYRGTAYNACIGGVRASPHLRFAAIDFRADKGSVADWQRIARVVRNSDPRFRGAIGRHADFLHIDTQGESVDW
jgi:Peptidase M15